MALEFFNKFSNRVIPHGEFESGMNFLYNFNNNNTNVSDGIISASLISETNYDLKIHSKDSHAKDNASFLKEVESNIEYIYISSNNANGLLFNASHEKTENDVHTFNSSLVSGDILDVLGESIVEYTLTRGGSSDLDVKNSCRVATTTNITLSGSQTIDVVSIIADDRVLVKNQSTGSENGIYICQTDTWTRASDFDSDSEVTTGAFTFIEEGTINKYTGWVLTTYNPITVGTDGLEFTQFSGGANDTAITNETTRATAAEGVNATNIATNASAISTNVTAISTNASAISTNVTNIATNASAISTNVTAISTNASAISTNVTNIATNTSAISTNTSAISTNVTDITTNATNIATNASAISTNASAISTNVTAISTNVTDIATNVTNIATNASAISTNASAISTNASAISTNVTNIATNASAISTNVTAISTNASAISTNTSAISTNVTAISTNVTNIATNTSAISTNVTNIATNTSAISTNVTDIATNVTAISTNASAISTNVTDIATNVTDIATNTSAISTNASAISTNVTAISTNASAISTNVTDIATNVTDIATNVTDIATNVTDIATNATNIATNTSAISTNVTNIATNATNIATNVTDIATNATNIATNASAIGGLNLNALSDCSVNASSVYIGNVPDGAATGNATYNTSVGITALDAITTGDNNSAFGYLALKSNNSGSNNVAIGVQAGYNMIGSNNIFIGYKSGSSTALVSESNKLYIHNNTSGVPGSVSGPLIGGDFSASQVYINGALTVSGDITAFASSDKRLKNNLEKINDPLDKLNKINGYTFDWIEKEGIHSNKGHDIGVIAQEIEEVLPEVVVTRENGYKAVRYEKIVPLLIETIKEQQKQINKLNDRLEKLENMFN